MFATLSRSWEFTKISYSILWQHKSLVAFPIISGVASLLVLGTLWWIRRPLVAWSFDEATAAC